jgi:AAA ATPase domain
MIIKMTTNPIKSFAIYGLFGTTHVHIPLNEPVKILVGENGLGKTQVLNLFYYTLTQNFFKLLEFNFEKLVLTLVNNTSIEIKKVSIENSLSEIYQDKLVQDAIQRIGYERFIRLRNKYIHGSDLDRYELTEYEMYATRPHSSTYSAIFKALEIEHSIIKNKGSRKFLMNDSIIEKYKKEIQSIVKNVHIMYFPTFRRVEEDLHNLGYEEHELQLNQENTLIQFGMDDVQKKFNEIQEKIDKLLKEGLAQFTKDILNTMTEDSELDSNDILNKINEAEIAIILARVGNQLPEKQKVAIRNIVRTKQFKNPFHAYLLQKLVELYEKQTTLDHSIKSFRDACNKYLINKQVFYDESGIKIFVKSEITDEDIHLSKLSSGEKQIISIFSKIYLSEANKRFMVLFDEPELSLSMLWQRQLLPDIVNSQKCNFLLAVTHSPFIFDNELDKYAVGLDEYVKPMKGIIAMHKSIRSKTN